MCEWKDCPKDGCHKYGGIWLFCEEHLLTWMELYCLADGDMKVENWQARSDAWQAYTIDNKIKRN